MPFALSIKLPEKYVFRREKNRSVFRKIIFFKRDFAPQKV